MQKQFIPYRQLDAMDCGPTSLRMVAKHCIKFLYFFTLYNCKIYI